MDRNIQIEIRDRIAHLTGNPEIICGNDDYRVTFTFDDEWSDINVKTLRVSYNNQFSDHVFTGNVVTLPPIIKAIEVHIGVFAGDITSTKISVRAVPSIRCLGGSVADPEPDVYNQIIALINEIEEKIEELPEWVKQPEKPTYTAEDVGAQPKGDYALKEEIPPVPVDSVNGKIGAVLLNAEDVRADAAGSAAAAEKAAKEYTDHAISEIPTPDVSGQISTHNADPYAHGDIQLLISALNERLNALSDNKIVANINDGIRVIDSGLTFSRGVVEVRKNGEILWIMDSGVYNFTSSFKQANNRTVLEFDLPKSISEKMPNVNGVYGTTGTVSYFPALAYENVTYTTFNCQSYIKRTKVGEEYDTFQLVYTGCSVISGGGLCGFHLRMPILLV